MNSCDTHKHHGYVPFARILSLATALLAIAPLNFAFAQTVGKISGVVLDASTREPIPLANIIIVGTNLGASANMEGEYFILNISPGKYDLQASVIGYQKMTVQEVIVNSGRTTEVNFELPEEAVELNEVVVQATRPDVEKEKTSTSEIVRFEDVQALPGVRNIGDIVSLAADVIDGHFRGRREGEEYYRLQGMGIVNPLDNSSAFLPIMSGVEEVEVITRKVVEWNLRVGICTVRVSACLTQRHKTQMLPTHGLYLQEKARKLLLSVTVIP